MIVYTLVRIDHWGFAFVLGNFSYAFNRGVIIYVNTERVAVLRGFLSLLDFPFPAKVVPVL